MSNYNLSDNVQDSFEFNIRGLDFVMRYPRTDEIDIVQELNVQLEEAQENKDKDAIKQCNEELETFLYSFISPKGHEQSITDVLDKENIKVMKNFQKMIRIEISLS